MPEDQANREADQRGASDASAPDAPVPDASGPDAPAPVELPLDRTHSGRRLLSVVILVLLGAMLVSNLPDSPLRAQLQQFERPITDATGLSQNWALFAPDPRSTFLRLRAEIEREDGTVEEWVPPVGDRFIGVMRTYRWRKWSNAVVAPDASRLHRGAVHYLAALHDDPGASPVSEVRLYRGVHRQPGPGSGEPADRAPDFEEELLLRSTVTPDAGDQQ